MTIAGLTKQQSDFIETFITIPFLIGRDSAKAKRKEWANEFKVFNDRKAQILAIVGTLGDGLDKSGLLGELTRIEGSLVQGEGRPDFEDAETRLQFVESACAIQEEYQRCKEAIDKVDPKVAEVLLLDPENRDDIESSLARTRDLARKGAMNHDKVSFAACRNELAALVEHMKTAQRIQSAAETDPEVLAAMAELRAAQAELARVRGFIASSFGASVPSSLPEHAAVIDTILAGIKRRDANDIRAAAQKAGFETAELERNAEAALEDREELAAAMAELTEAGQALARARAKVTQDFDGTLPEDLGIAADGIASDIAKGKTGDKFAARAAADAARQATEVFLSDAGDALVTWKELQVSLAELKKAEVELADAVSDTSNLFDEKVPVTLIAKSDKIAEDIKAAESGDKPAVDAATSAALVAIAALRKSAETMVAAKRDWDLAQNAFAPVMSALRNHPSKTDAVFVAPLIARIEAASEAAEKKADDLNDYGGARTDLMAQIELCRKAISTADDVSEYEAVLADRTARKDALPAANKVIEGAPRLKVEEVATLYAEAVAAFALGQSDKNPAHIAVALEKLRKIPDAAHAAEELHKYSQSYEDAHSRRAKDAETFEAWGEPYATDLGPEIRLFRKLVDEGALDSEKDKRTAAQYQKAEIKLRELRKYRPTILNMYNQIRTYERAFQALKDRITEFDAITEENGKAAIEAYLARMKSDKLYAEARFVAKDYVNAISASEASKGEFKEQKALAALAKDYLARKKDLDDRIAQMRVDGGGRAEEVADSMVLMVDRAKAQATAKNWQAAIDVLAQAEARIAGAEKVANDIKEAAEYWENVETETPADAHSKFVIYRDDTKAMDTDNLMGAEFDAQTKAADDALADAQSGGDAAAASTAIGQAFNQVYWIAMKLAYYDQYKALNDAMKQAHEVELPDAEFNKDNCVAWYINKIGEYRTQADGKAASPNFNFADAVKDLMNAETVAVNARQISKDWKASRDDLVKIGKVRSKLGSAPYTPDFDSERARLSKYNSDCQNALKAAKADEAIKLVREGAALADALDAQAKTYASAKRVMASKVDPIRASIDQGTAPHAGDARTKLAQLEGEYDALLKARASDAARSVAWKCHHAINDGVAVNKLGVAYFALKKTVSDKLAEYEKKNSVDNVKVSERLEQLNKHFGLGIDFDEGSDVETWEARQNYSGGIKRLTPIPGELAKLDADIKAYGDCKAQRDKAGQLIGEILKTAGPDNAVLAARLRGKHQSAVSYMNEGNYAVALTMFTELEADAAEAKANAELVKGFQDQIDAAAPGEDDSGLAEKVEAARKALADLRGKPNSDIADKELEEGDAQVEAARKALPDDADAVKAGIAAAMTQAQDALRKIELFRQLDASAEYARKQLAALDGHAQTKFVAADIKARREALVSQMDGAAKKTIPIDAAMQRIEELMAEIHAVRHIADDHQAFLDEKKVLDEGLAEMEKSKGRYAIREIVPAVRQQIADAVGMEDARKHADAMTRLKLARREQLTGLMEAKLEIGAAPTMDELKAILDMPDGDRKLDKIIEGLDPKAQRGALVAAMKVRFGCEVEVLKKSPETVDKDYDQWLIDTNDRPDDEKLAKLLDFVGKSGGKAKAAYDSWLSANAGASEEDKRKKLEELIKTKRDPAREKYDEWLIKENPKPKAEKDAKKKQMHDDNVQDAMDEAGPNIKKLYSLMAMCPTSDTRDNDSLLELSTSGGVSTGSFYSSRLEQDEAGEVKETKKLVMREGEVGNSSFYGIALPFELDELDDECQPVEGEPLSYFAWNTLHEVGHAVDDQKGIMRTSGNAKAGWIEHGANVLDIAREAAKIENFGYDESYIAAYLSGVSKPPIPAPPDPDKAEEWERKRIAVHNWADLCKVGKKPWSSASIAKTIALRNGRVYHESYGNRWNSYPLTERTKGVSGYQFRAPGEWFSELYASYHSGKMNPQHPYREWISKL